MANVHIVKRASKADVAIECTIVHNYVATSALRASFTTAGSTG